MTRIHHLCVKRCVCQGSMTSSYLAEDQTLVSTACRDSFSDRQAAKGSSARARKLANRYDSPFSDSPQQWDGCYASLLHVSLKFLHNTARQAWWRGSNRAIQQIQRPFPIRSHPHSWLSSVTKTEQTLQGHTVHAAWQACSPADCLVPALSLYACRHPGQPSLCMPQAAGRPSR